MFEHPMPSIQLSRTNRLSSRLRTWWKGKTQGEKPNLKIKFEDINHTQHGAFYVGDRQRMATCTAVKFVDENHLVTASCVGQNLYLVRFNIKDGTFKIIDELRSRFYDQFCSVDLLDFNGKDLIITSNCEAQSATLYRIKDQRINYYTDLPVKEVSSSFCHGASFVTWAENLACLCTTTGERNIILMDLESKLPLLVMNDGEWQPKDVCFPGDHQIIVIYARIPPRTSRGNNDSRVCKIQWLEIDSDLQQYEVLLEKLIPDSHIDGCHYAKGRIYISNQNLDLVHVFKIDKNTIKHDFDLKGYSFPHGIDIDREGKLLAVTNYGDNSVDIRRL